MLLGETFQSHTTSLPGCINGYRIINYCLRRGGKGGGGGDNPAMVKHAIQEEYEYSLHATEVRGRRTFFPLPVRLCLILWFSKAIIFDL